MTSEEKLIRTDRMRFTKDNLSSTLVLLAIVANVLYFVSIYETDIGSYYYNWVIGASVIYNLVFLLVAFLASVGVKSRQSGYMIPLLILGALQFGRIFYLPAKASGTAIKIGEEIVEVMSGSQHTYVVFCLAVSGVCCIAAAIISTVNNKTLARYMRSLEEKTV